jgi:serine/threonine protein phosphatase PrpC
VFVVSDGLGGHPAGDTAAAAVVDGVLATVAPDDDALEARILLLNQRIRALGETRSERRGLGATLVLAAVGPGSVRHAHVGDSRLYLCRAGGLVLLTPPHELTDVLVREGVLRPEEAAASPMRGRLTSYVGMEQPTVGVGRFESRAGDRLLLVTDGALEGGEGRLAEALSDPDLERVARTVASGHPSMDNATALLVEIDGRGADVR